MSELARLLIILGIILVVIGVIIWLAPKIPLLGRLPGDFTFHWGRTTVYFPLGTCILLSVILTLIMYFLRK